VEVGVDVEVGEWMGGGSSWLIIFPYIWELNCKDEAQTSIHV
jgi:hypothetical protein